MGPHSSEQGNDFEDDDQPHTWQASMGPHSSEQGNLLGYDVARPLSVRLQWGLTLPSKETIQERQTSEQALVASMGPHSSEQGNQRQSEHYLWVQRRFNGASLFRARKQIIVSCKCSPRSMLQWGLTLPSKETRGSGPMRDVLKRLQWGLTLPSKETPF